MQGLLIIIIFILFVLAFKKVMKIVMNAIWIVVAAVLFPIIASRVFNMPIPSDADTIMTFVVIGLGAYFVYLIGSSVYTILKYGERIGKKVVPDFKSKKSDKPGKYVKLKEPKEKEEDARKDFSHVKSARSLLIHKQLAAQNTKSEKEMYKDYIVVEDEEDKKENKSEESEKIDGAELKEEKKLTHIEPIKEIKFRRRKGKS